MKRIVCDFDETLVSTGRIHRQSFEEIAGTKISDVLAKNLRGKSDIQILNMLIPLEVDYEDLLKKRQRMLTEIALLADFSKLKKSGLDEFIVWARVEKIECAIASSSPDEFINTVISRLGIQDVFSLIVGSSRVAEEEKKMKLEKGSLSKPNPFSVALAAGEISYGEKIIYIGDNEVDCLTCLQEDFLAIIINNDSELAKKYPNMTFKSNLKEAIDVVKGL